MGRGSPKPEVLLRIRRYAGGEPKVSVWLIARNGAAESCLLFGEMLSDRAEELADYLEGLGLTVSREKSPLPYQELPRAKKGGFDLEGTSAPLPPP